MILIVDDDPGTTTNLTKLLHKAGHSTQTKSSGSELLASFDQAIPSLVILDMMMPGVDGLVCLEAIRSHPKWETVPVLVYSADTSQKRINSAKKLGAQEYVVKGRVPWNEFLQVINRYERPFN